MPAVPLLRLAYGSATKQDGKTLGNFNEQIRGVWRERGQKEVGGPHGVRFRLCAAHAYLCPAVKDRRTASGYRQSNGSSGRPWDQSQ